MYQERMNSYYPDVIRKITEFKSIIDTEYPEFEDISLLKDSVTDNAYLTTMGEDRIAEWEKIFSIKPISGSSVEDRRETIIARIRGQGKLNTELINVIVKTFTGGTANSWVEDSILYVEITPPKDNKQYIFANVEQELIKKIPAHLGFQVSRNYYTWNEIKNEYGTWGTVNAAFDTWRDVLLFVPFDSATIEVTGMVIKIADSIVAPLQGLNIYGQTTQDGTPTPDAPVELVSVENPYVTISGKNFVPYPHYDTTETLYDITFTDNGDGTITANGTATGDSSYSCVALGYHTIPIKAGKYTISGCPPGGGAFTYELAVGYRETQDGTRQLNFERGDGLTVEWLEDGYIDVICVVRNGTIADNLVFRPQIELGDVVTDFESYIEPQSISVPYTLHGIPVTDGGNYTDANGQQWITDEIDFERGVYIQRLDFREFDGTETFHIISTLDDGLRVGTNWDGLIYPNYDLKCSHLPTQQSVPGITQGANASPSYYVPYATIEEWVAYLSEQYTNGTPMTVVVPLETQIETTLTTEELEAYQALHTNNPNTTVFNAVNAPMVVKYKQVDKRS